MKKRWTRHFLFWLAYLVFETYTEFEWITRQYYYPVVEGLFAAFASESVQVLAIKIPLVYVLFYFLERYTFRKGNKVTLVLIMTVALATFSLLARLLYVSFILPEIYIRHENSIFLDFQGFVDSFMDKVFIAGVAIALKQYSISQKLQQREHKLIREKLETELNFLKSQVNPHFLFNTLNNIYSLARKKSDDTADVVIRLSKLLRFMLYETQHQKISIEKEIHFLSDYIEHEKMRYGDRLNIRFNHVSDDANAGILPLILVPFVENAFKHGASETTAKAFIDINLELKDKQLLFTVKNSFEQESVTQIKEGIGLKNLKRQLELRYPDFDLHTQHEGATFIARLSLNLNEMP